MLYLALSCLQGTPSKQAVEELWELEPDGIQLTPGNYPERGFRTWFLSQNIPFKLHEGFDWSFRRRPVWGDYGECLALEGATIHPPKTQTHDVALQQAVFDSGRVLETMYPGYVLGYERSLQEAMDAQIPLAVDVSHIDLQFESSVISQECWQRLQAYEHIHEIHVSQTYKGKDAHRALTRESFGLQWAREHTAPVVLECYMHRLSKDERQRQVEMIRGR